MYDLCPGVYFLSPRQLSTIMRDWIAIYYTYDYTLRHHSNPPVQCLSVNKPQKIQMNQNIIDNPFDTLQITWENTGRIGIGIRGTLTYSSPITFIHIHQTGTGIYYRIWGTFTSRNCLYVFWKDIIINSFLTLPVCVCSSIFSVQSRGWGQVLVYTAKGVRGCGDTWQRHCCYTKRGWWFR